MAKNKTKKSPKASSQRDRQKEVNNRSKQMDIIKEEGMSEQRLLSNGKEHSPKEPDMIELADRNAKFDGTVTRTAKELKINLEAQDESRDEYFP
jgi:hypothetical protein